MSAGGHIEFAPSVYEHAAALIGKTPGQVSRDAELLFQAHAAAFRLYRHAPVVVGIDIYNLEAEAYGAVLDRPAGNGIPAVAEPPCANVDAVLKLDPFDPRKDGRIPMAIETGRRLARAFPEADVRIPLSGPFSLAGNLLGLNRLLCGLADDPPSVGRALRHLAHGQIAFCREVFAQGLGIAFFESGAAPPLVSPALFAAVVLPVLAFVVRETSRIAGRPVPCIVGGNTLPVLGSILETGTKYVICPAETDQAAFMREMRACPDVKVRINTQSGVFARGDWPAVCRELDRVLALAENRANVCIGTGALPFEAVPDLVLKAAERVRRSGASGRRKGVQSS